MSLYKLTEDWQTVYSMLSDEEVSDQAVFDTLESLEFDIAETMENCGKIIRNAEAEAKALKDEEGRLYKKRKQKELAVSRMKSMMQHTMETIGVKKMTAGVFDFTIRDNQPSVHVLNESVIPEEYFVPQEPKLDKKALLAALKAGKAVDGAQLGFGRTLLMR